MSLNEDAVVCKPVKEGGKKNKGKNKDKNKKKKNKSKNKRGKNKNGRSGKKKDKKDKKSRSRRDLVEVPLLRTSKYKVSIFIQGSKKNK